MRQNFAPGAQIFIPSIKSRFVALVPILPLQVELLENDRQFLHLATFDSINLIYSRGIYTILFFFRSLLLMKTLFKPLKKVLFSFVNIE